MTKQAATDAGIGRAVFATRLMLSIRALSMSLMFGALPAFILPYAIWMLQASERDVDMVRIGLVSAVTSEDKQSRWEMRDGSGEYRVIEALLGDGRSAVELRPSEVRRALLAEWGAWRVFQLFVLASLILPALGYAAVWYFLIRLGRKNMADKRLRGAEELITAKDLNSLVRTRDGSDYKFAQVSLPKKAPMQGLLALGAQGTGKSLVIHDLMQQVFAKGRKCFIYDQSGEFFRAYYRPGKDFFFNPACEGSVPWSIFSELKYVYDADSMAQAFLPPKAGVVHGANAFFEDAARALFSVMLSRLANYGAINTQDLAKAIFEMPDEEMDRLIEKSVASSAVGGDSKGQRQGVISSISIYLAGIQAVQPGNWSVRDFLEADDDARFFILGTDDTKAMFTPLYRLLLTASFAMIAAKQEIVHEDKYWFFLDEVLTLGDIKLDEALATLRKFGVCVVSGLQSESQVVASVGQERAETIMNCFNTLLTLRLNDASMMERAAKRLGKLELETVSQNQALAVTEARDGAGVNISDQEKWLVMPSEIGSLDNCTGFVKLAGGYPAARIDYRSWLPKRPGASAYVDRFAPVQESPPRDPRFTLSRRFEAGSVDPLVKFKEDFDAAKTGEKSTQPKGSTEASNASRNGLWAASGLEAQAAKTAKGTAEQGSQDERVKSIFAPIAVEVQQTNLGNLLLGQVNQDHVGLPVGQEEIDRSREGVTR